MTDPIEILRNLPPYEREEFLDSLPKDEADEILEILEELETRDDREVVKTDFMAFTNHVWPEFIHGRHLSLIHISEPTRPY